MNAVSAAAPVNIPALDIDPFCEAFFADPYPVHEALRNAGPLVWLPRYGVAAVARHEEVRQVLADLATEGRFRLPSLLLEADPPTHDRARRVMNKALSAGVMKRLRERFAGVAQSMVQELLERRECDAIAHLAEAFPLRVFPDAIGMQREGRDNLLPYGDMVFNSFGPENKLFAESAPRAATAFPWVRSQALRENLAADGFGMIIYEAADCGEISEEEGAILVRGMLAAGVDTTVNGIGAALYCLLNHPVQWNTLRANLSLARAAFEEAIRLESPVQTFFRTTTGRAELAGAVLAAGQKVLTFLGAANRDPRKWDRPNEYDIERVTAGHVGFGVGIHVCVGQSRASKERPY